MRKLTEVQQRCLRDVRKNGVICTWGPNRTVMALERKGLVETTGTKRNYKYEYRLTEAGRAALREGEKP